MEGVFDGFFDYFCFFFYVVCWDSYRSVDDVLLLKEWMFGFNWKLGLVGVDMLIGYGNVDLLVSVGL